LAETNTHRDPEIIRREIMIADLSASNCALQADGIYKQIEALQMKAEGLKAPHDQHVARAQGGARGRAHAPLSAGRFFLIVLDVAVLVLAAWFLGTLG
jgi:hypothetical protein